MKITDEFTLSVPIEQVSEKLLGQFVACLESNLAAGELTPAAPQPKSAPAVAEPVAKRVVPLLLGILVVVIVHLLGH